MEIKLLKQHPALIATILAAILAASCGACFLQYSRSDTKSSHDTATTQVQP